MATLPFLRFTGAAYRRSTSKGLMALRPVFGVCRNTSVPTTRHLTTSQSLQSGHSRWSKIKHDKAKADAKTNKLRSVLAKLLEAASKEGGPNPQENAKLGALVKQAATAGFPKASISAAIARGQGLSPSGATLTPYTIELLHGPTGAAAIVECLTDNKARTLQVVREAMRECDASGTATEWMFERRGRLVFDAGSEPWSDDLEMAFVDAAAAAGALDIVFPRSPDAPDPEFDDADALVYTAPQEMPAVAAAMQTALDGRTAARAELVWAPKPETVVAAAEGDDPEGKWASLDKLVQKIEDESTVAAVWLNVR